MSSAILRARRRPRGGSAEEEDATKLDFGPEYTIPQYAPDGQEEALFCLNLSETRLLINAALAQRKQDPTGANDAVAMVDDDEEDFADSNEVLRKTREYLSTFARFKDEQTVNAVEHLLKSSENVDLHPFEIAQLGSLVCDDAEEAKTLIPSLAFKKNDEDLQVLLDQLRRFS